MIQPHDVTLTRTDGTTVTLVVSKLPAIQGREIMTQYVVSAMPKVGDYENNATLMRKMMAYAAVRLEDGTTLQLTNDALINNHLGDWETLIKAEYQMLEYNTSFLKKHVTADGLPQLMTMLKASFKKALQNTKSS